MEEEAAGEKPPTQTVVEVEPQVEKKTGSDLVVDSERKKSGDKQIMLVEEPAYRPPTLKDFYLCLGILLGLAVIFGIVIIAIYAYGTTHSDSFLYHHESKDSEMATTKATTDVGKETDAANPSNTGTGAGGPGAGGPGAGGPGAGDAGAGAPGSGSETIVVP